MSAPVRHGQGHCIFELEAVTKVYPAGPGASGFALEVPTLKIPAGHRIGIVAPSGLGKSTLLDLLVFAARPTSGGTFDFNAPDRPVTSILDTWSRGRDRVFSALRKRHIGMVVQTGGLLPFLTARGNIELPLRLSGQVAPVPVDELAERLGFAEQLNLHPRQLSIGQRQRVAIARALVHHPLVIVADEPTASLDRSNADGVMRLLVDLTEQVGVTLIVATHDARLVDEYGFEVLDHDHAAGNGDSPARTRFWN